MKQFGFFLIVLLVALSVGCGRTDIPSASDAAKAQQEPVPGSAAAPALSGSNPGAANFSYINTGDARAAAQLLSGWYNIEDGSFRWIGREAQASVAVPPDPGAFEVRIFIPQGHIERVGGPVVLKVLFSDTVFAQETFTAAGPYTLRRPVPAGTVSAPSVKVTLRLSRAILPTAADKRELGAVVQGIGFVK